MSKPYTPAENAERMIANAITAGQDAERLTLQNYIRAMASDYANLQETVDILLKSLDREREYSTNLCHEQDELFQQHFRHGRESVTTEAAMQFRHMMDMIKEGKKIQAIKSLRMFTNLGLKDAKDYIDTISIAYGTPPFAPSMPWDSPVATEPPPEIRDASEGGPGCGCSDCTCDD